MKTLIYILLLSVMLVGYDEPSESPNNKADGNVTEKESREMQRQWCEYNKGEDFAKEQCEEI